MNKVKKTISFIVVLMLALVAVLSMSSVAYADDAINTSVRVSPATLSGEGTASVTVTIKNNGDPVSNVQLKYPSPTDTVISLGDIGSGDTKTHDNGDWNISADMLDKDLAFTVMWTSQDGTQKSGNTQSFMIQKQDISIKVSGSATADVNEVEKGGNVKFSFSFKNDGNTLLENCKLTAPMIDGGAQIGEEFTLEPGATNNKTYTVAVNENMTVTPTYKYDTNGQTFTYKLDPINITVKEAPKTVTMSVTLNTDKTDAKPGDIVKFTVKVTNTGTSNLDGLTAKDFDGNNVPLSATSLQPGQSATGTTDIPINVTGNYQFTVSAVGAGGVAIPQRSNAVAITAAGGQPTADPTDVIDPSRVVRTYVEISTLTLKDGPGPVTVKASVENLTDKELKNVVVINDLVGTIGNTQTLAAGATQAFEKTFTVEETGDYMFVTTAELPDGTFIESKTNAATITVVTPEGGLSPAVMGGIIIAAIVVVGAALGIYIVRARKKANTQNREFEERMRTAGANGRPRTDRYAASQQQRSRMNGAPPEYPDKSVYTNRKPPARVETMDPPPRSQQQRKDVPQHKEVPRAEAAHKEAPPQVGRVGKPGTKFGDRNKF